MIIPTFFTGKKVGRNPSPIKLFRHTVIGLAKRALKWQKDIDC